MFVYALSPKEKLSSVWENYAYVGGCFVHARSETDARQFLSDFFNPYGRHMQEPDTHLDSVDPWSSPHDTYCGEIATLDSDCFHEGQIEVVDGDQFDVAAWSRPPDGSNVLYENFRKRRIVRFGAGVDVNSPHNTGVTGEGHLEAGPATVSGQGTVGHSPIRIQAFGAGAEPEEVTAEAAARGPILGIEKGQDPESVTTAKETDTGGTEVQRTSLDAILAGPARENNSTNVFRSTRKLFAMMQLSWASSAENLLQKLAKAVQTTQTNGNCTEI